jgi:ceramide glucosyltransferase
MVIFLATVLGLTLGAHVLSAGLAAWRLRRRVPVEGAERPHVSLIRPVCGVDRFDRETLSGSFSQDYPDYEVLFCAASEQDPAVALLRDLIAAHPDVPARVLIGEDMISANPKLNNLVNGVREGRGDWLAMADSNLTLPPEYLSELVASWRADTGLVSAPPVGVRPENFWGAVECAFLNSNQARWQLAADSLGLGFAQGKTLFWRRDVLEAGGGLAALGQNIAEDVASTKLVRRQGLRVHLPGRLFQQPIGKREARAVWDRQLRWNRVRRDGFPTIFAAEVLQGPLWPFAALAGLWARGAAPGWSIPALLGLWYATEWALARRAGWPAGPRDVAAMIFRDALLPALWIATFARRGFSWRGTEMAAAPVATPAG